MSAASEKQRERARKEMDGVPNAFTTPEAERRLGSVAAQAFIGGARTALLVKQASGGGEVGDAGRSAHRVPAARLGACVIRGGVPYR